MDVPGSSLLYFYQWCSYKLPCSFCIYINISLGQICRSGIPDWMTFAFKIDGQDWIASIKTLPINTSTDILFVIIHLNPSLLLQDPWVREDPLEDEMETHSTILSWGIPWTEEPGGLQSTESQRVGHDWGIERAHTHTLAFL